MRGQGWRAAGLLSGALLLLGGCAAPVGDFGRRAGGLYSDVVTDVSGPLAYAMDRDQVASFPYTDEEETLRHVAWDLVRPPDRSVPGNALSRFTWHRALPDGYHGDYPQAYWRTLLALPVASHTSRFQRIGEQARSDAARMPGFRQAATRVQQADATRRAAALAAQADRTLMREAERRIAENRAVVDAVCRAIAVRIEAYRYALTRLAIETPSTAAADADAAVEALAWEAGACGAMIVSPQALASRSPRAAVQPFRPGGDAPIPDK